MGGLRRKSCLRNRLGSEEPPRPCEDGTEKGPLCAYHVWGSVRRLADYFVLVTEVREIWR